ncbi:S8 family peptidase [Pontibacillus litoralis]|uniref:Peptidase S8/S53 domain-containing protein n=1 Tax=Pontibacillus litoralis JSM 072002 TaxID=1385512 RepID=A0A0A5GAY6_9BACI|nr:S8 family serine peptidase [Pontibacillus litoralis]KGX88280.1 hypothetical protein N784_11075 [Pontibacillus litoralis JSM 072002]
MHIRSLILFLLYSIFAYLFQATFDTEDTIVAVLDSGIDMDHPMFEERLLQGFDLIDGDHIPNDEVGHGTQVTGIIMQLTEDSPVQVLPVRKLGNPNNTSLAILLSIISGADIVNMSFHQPYNPITQKVIEYGANKDVLFIASSGNEGKDTLTYPAKYEHVIPVAATNNKNSILSGNYGEGITYISPGINVLSAGLGGELTTTSGTSIASAYATGVFAYLKAEYPQASSEELVQYVNRYSRTIMYTIDDKHLELKTLDMAKFKAVTNKNSYMWFSDIHWGSEETMAPSIKLDAYNIDRLYLHDKGTFYQTYTGNTNSIMLPSHEGNHDVRIHFHDGDTWQDRRITYEIDSTPPTIETTITNNESAPKLHVQIDEPNIANVLINGHHPKHYLGYGPVDATLNHFTIIRPKETIVIEAIDTHGNSNTKIIH